MYNNEKMTMFLWCIIHYKKHGEKLRQGHKKQQKQSNEMGSRKESNGGKGRADRLVLEEEPRMAAAFPLCIATAILCRR